MNYIIKDPVCGMDVSEFSEFHTMFDGKEYYFCSQKCQQKFVEAPQKYAIQKEVSCTQCEPIVAAASTGHVHTHKEDETADKDVIYTCPMHPEIRQIGPGTCPKCGMALEPLVSKAAGEDSDGELKDMTRRFKISTLLAVPVFLLAMVADLAPQWLPQWLSMSMVQWIEFLLATPVVLWGGWPFFVRGVQS